MTETTPPPWRKVALVTGASRGIGRAIALALARQGMSVALGYRQDEAAASAVAGCCRELGVEAETYRGDLADPATPAFLCSHTFERFGRLDVLVNNAAVVTADLLATLDDADLEAMLAINVGALVRLSRAVLRPMLRQRKGAIINVSSIAARRPGRGNSVYAGTKGFVESFTRALAVEVGKKGIRVNAVAPGLIETEMSGALRALAGEAVVERIALRRFGVADDVAAAVAFLASDEAAYITGAVLPVDGAMSGGS